MKPDPCTDPRHRRRPAPAVAGTELCHEHLLEHLRAGLLILAGLHRDLEQVLVRRGSEQEGSAKRGITVGISLDLDATKAREHVRVFLVGWCQVVLEEGPPASAPADTVAAMSDWLSHRAAWLIEQAWVDELAGNLDECRDECTAALQPERVRRMEIGDCPERLVDEQGQDTGPCDGTLFALIRPTATLLPSEVLCTSTRLHAWTPSQWHALGRRVSRQVQDENAARALAAELDKASGT